MWRGVPSARRGDLCALPTHTLPSSFPFLCERAGTSQAAGSRVPNAADAHPRLNRLEPRSRMDPISVGLIVLNFAGAAVLNHVADDAVGTLWRRIKTSVAETFGRDPEPGDFESGT